MNKELSEEELIYKEYEDARDYFYLLGATNSYSLDTPQKKIEFEVIYEKARQEYYNATIKKDKLITNKLYPSKPTEFLSVPEKSKTNASDT